MRIWPVILDSQPSYLQGRGRSGSLLLAPRGTSILLRELLAALRSVTDNPPLVVAPHDADSQYEEWIEALAPGAVVARTAAQLSDSVISHELSDTLLFVDPRCMPAQGYRFAPLVRHHSAEPRVSHHLVAFERAHDGTKERVCFDAAGQVRAIQRHYEHATWPFI